MKLNGLEKYFKTVNGEIVDFKQVDEFEKTPLIYALKFNRRRNLNLSNEQWNYIIKNSDLKQIDNNDMSPLMYALEYNKAQDLNLSTEQWDYLIQNSDLKQVDEARWSPLMFAFELNKSNNLNLTNKQWKYMIEQSDVSLINKENLLLELKKIQSELLNEDILNKIDIKADNKKINKI